MYQGLRCEDRYCNMYAEVLKVPHQQGMKGAHKHGILFGFSQAAQYFGWGITTYYGGYLVVKVPKLFFYNIFMYIHLIVI